MKPSRRKMLQTLTGIGAAALLGEGCGKKEDGAGTTTPQPASPAGGTAATHPLAALPSMARLVIDGYPVTFPAAHLRVQGTSPLSMALFSDQAGQDANTFYFEIMIDGVEDVSMLDGAVWQVTAANDRTDDLLTTIQLEGGARQLQPQEISVLFSTDGQRVTAKLGGRWGVFTHTDALLPERAVLVTGELAATIETQ